MNRVGMARFVSSFFSEVSDVKDILMDGTNNLDFRNKKCV
jgi:hypothetical protein